MSPALTLTEFLDARIAEDEAATPADETWRAKWHTVDCGVGLGYWANDECTCDGPARVLAECAAKRKMIGMHRCSADAYGDPAGNTCTMCADSGPEAQAYPCDTLLALAAVYAGHPDYRQEWAL